MVRLPLSLAKYNGRPVSSDAIGNRSRVVHANGNIQTYSYDELNRLINMTLSDAQSSTLSSFEYTLNSSGMRTKITEHDGTTTHYTYDNLNRLLTENIDDPQQGSYGASYTYDSVGNRVESIIDGVTTAYSYDDNDRLTQQGGTTYTYDANGNTLSETLDGNTTAYSYNAKNQLSKIETDSTTTQYRYNIDGIRTDKITDTDEIHYVLDSTETYAQVVQEHSSTNPTIRYTYGDDLISQKRNNQTFDYHYDGLGSVRYLSDESGTLTDTYDYEAFGKLIHRLGDTNNSYLFSGEQFDQESQNYYLRARYYNELIGRFTQQDSYQGSMGDPVTLHKYLYANANPVMYVDPTGHYSMVDVSMAMSVRNMLSNIQIDSYTTVLDVVSGNYEGSTDISLGLNLMLRFVPGFRKKVCGNSFDAETLIATENGLLPIEEIKIGDRVWAYNETNQSKSLQEVTHLIKGEGLKELIDIELENGEIITATVNHPLYSLQDNLWKDAGELNTTSLLLSLHDQNISVEEIDIYSKEQTVYNLTVANDHTYFVGQSGVLGHNSECSNIDAIVRKLVSGIPKSCNLHSRKTHNDNVTN